MYEKQKYALTKVTKASGEEKNITQLSFSLSIISPKANVRRTTRFNVFISKKLFVLPSKSVKPNLVGLLPHRFLFYIFIFEQPAVIHLPTKAS